MTSTLFTAPDCRPCQAVKRYLGGAGRLDEVRILDFAADREEYIAFYRRRRAEVRRGDEGVEFPILVGEEHVDQGAGRILARLVAGDALDSAVRPSILRGADVDGLVVSEVPDGQEEAFATVVRALAAGGLVTHVTTDGRRPDLLARLAAEGVVGELERM